MNTICRIIIYLFAITSSLKARSASPSGEVICWGNNFIGQALGSSSGASGLIIINNKPITNAIAVSAGRNHNLALKSDGTVVGWGWNKYGQATGAAIENTDNAFAGGLVMIDGKVLENIKAIAAGDDQSLALKIDGTIVGWGKIASPSGTTNVISIASSAHDNYALQMDGTLVGWPAAASRTHFSNLLAIARGGEWFSPILGLLKGGIVIQLEHRGNKEPVPDFATNVTAMAVGSLHCLVLRADGSVMGWGNNLNGQTTGIPSKEPPYLANGSVAIKGQELNNVKAIAAGGSYSLALKNDGSLVGWGILEERREIDYHQMEIPPDCTNIIAIAVGDGFCLAIRKNK
jgi:trimeric autotransporter adhesin